MAPATLIRPRPWRAPAGNRAARGRASATRSRAAGHRPGRRRHPSRDHLPSTFSSSLPRLLLPPLRRAWAHGLGLERSVAHIEIGFEPLLALSLQQLLAKLIVG